MDEASKTLALLSEEELACLQGKGLDIGCGADPVKPDAQCFDKAQGDANRITDFLSALESYDYVFSSHCLEHMYDPRKTIVDWWKLVRPGGTMFVIVPDEDLYEQGYWPSLFNGDHKATFTISKERSWSPVSVNVLDLARSLKDATVVSARLQDHGYRRDYTARVWPRALVKTAIRIRRAVSRHAPALRAWVDSLYFRLRFPMDQTSGPAVAQNILIARKDR